MCPRLYLTSIILAGIRFGKSWKRKKEREQMNKSKDRCYVCLTVWPDLAIFTTLTKNSAFATKFGGSFSIWHIVEQTLANFVCYWANLGAHLAFGTLVNKLWQILYAIGQIWIVVFVSLVVSTLVNEFVRLSLASARKQKA